MEQKDFETLQTFLHQGGSLKMLADVDEKDLGLLYRYGTQLMNYGDYEGCQRIFYLLMKIRPVELRLLFFLRYMLSSA